MERGAVIEVFQFHYGSIKMQNNSGKLTATLVSIPLWFD